MNILGSQITELVIPFGITFSGVVDWFWGTFLVIAGIYLILAWALNLQWGYLGIFNFGVVAFFMVGAYTSALFSVGPPGEFEQYIEIIQLPVPLNWIAGMLAAGILALFVGLPVLRLRHDYLAIVTIGIAQILRSVANSTDGFVNRNEGLQGLSKPFEPYLHDLLRLIGIDRVDQLANLLVIAFFVSLIGLFFYLLTTTPWARTLRLLRDSEAAAPAFGKNIAALRLQTFVIGSMIIGFAGALSASISSVISPSSFNDFERTFLVWVMVIVGGSGRNLGTIIGVLLITGLWFGVSLFQEILPSFIDDVESLRLIVIGVIMLLFLIFRPNGILPEKPQVSRFYSKKDVEKIIDDKEKLIDP